MGYNVRKKADPVPARAPARAPFEVGFITALLCDVSPADQRFTHIPLENCSAKPFSHTKHTAANSTPNTLTILHTWRGGRAEGCHAILIACPS